MTDKECRKALFDKDNFMTLGAESDYLTHFKNPKIYKLYKQIEKLYKQIDKRLHKQIDKLYKQIDKRLHKLVVLMEKELEE